MGTKRVVDVIRELMDYGVHVDVHDPWAVPAGARRDYQTPRLGSSTKEEHCYPRCSAPELIGGRVRAFALLPQQLLTPIRLGISLGQLLPHSSRRQSTEPRRSALHR